MTKQLTPLRRKDIATGRKLEREAMVKWLRALPVPITDDVASAIEAEEHLK